VRRLEAWSEVKRAEALAARGGRPLVPGVDFSVVKASDYPGKTDLGVAPDYRRRPGRREDVGDGEGQAGA
jgi:hypothetical protein